MSTGLPPLHVLALDTEAEEAGFLATVERMLDACGPTLALHLRLKEATTRRLYELARATTEIAHRTGGWCVVNGRPDVALAARAAAVQLGRGAIPIPAARRVCEDRLRIGASVHGVEEALRAARGGANHLVLGTIYPTPSHPELEGAGPGIVRHCREALDRLSDPVGLMAIGGIDASRVAAVLDAGADGVAIHGAVWATEDPIAAAARLGEIVSAGENRWQLG